MRGCKMSRHLEVVVGGYLDGVEGRTHGMSKRRSWSLETIGCLAERVFSAEELVVDLV
jgi:hypothetical protein